LFRATIFWLPPPQAEKSTPMADSQPPIVKNPVETAGPDPNAGSTDPMVADYWKLGEDLQDRIRDAGYESEIVEGIAVDVHDLLQACDRVREEIIPEALTGDLVVQLKRLQFELSHIRWHTQAAETHLRHALAALEPRNEQPL
jgi:hypothetical protein